MSWPTTLLADECEVITKGTTPTTLGFAFQDKGVGFLRVQNIRDGKVNYDTDTLFIDERTHAALERSQIRAGDVLVSIAGTIGRAGVVPENAPSLNCNQALAIVRSRPSLCRTFLRHWLESTNAQTQMRGATVTGTIANLSLGQIGKLLVPLPSLSEQRRIAEVLDRAESLRTKRRAALAQLDTLTQSIFLDLFGDPATNPRQWPTCALADLCENEDSRRVPVKSSDRETSVGTYPYYGASGIIDQVDNFIFDGERLLIGEDGANLVARSTPVAFIARGKYWVNNHAHVLASNGRAELRFLEYFIELMNLEPYISGTAQPKLNRANLDRIPVFVVSLALQRDFVHRVEAVEKLKSAQRASLAELDALFASLQHRAFRGEL